MATAQPYGRRLTPVQVCRVHRLIERGFTDRAIAERMNVSHVTIYRIRHGERYAGVEC